MHIYMMNILQPVQPSKYGLPYFSQCVGEEGERGRGKRGGGGEMEWKAEEGKEVEEGS